MQLGPIHNVWTLAARIVRSKLHYSPMEIDDAVSELVIHAWRVKQKHPNASMQLLTVSMKHKLLDIMRALKTKDRLACERPTDEDGSPDLNDHDAIAYTIEGDVLDFVELTALISEVESVLTPREMRYLQLVADGLTYTEIADTERVQLTTVKSTLRRARSKAAKAMPHACVGRVPSFAPYEVPRALERYQQAVAA
jgi:DNA-directed RNA polymerase specialized sigma24 family protein